MKCVLGFLLTICSQFALSQSERLWYLEGESNYYGSSESYEAVELLYGHYFNSDKAHGFYVYGYHDSDYWSIYAGPSFSIGDVEIGIGIGESHYDKESWRVYNIWVWYENDYLTLEVTIEYTPDEYSSYQWYHKGDLTYSVNDSLYAGLYSERWVGTGPMVGYWLTESVALETIAPFIDDDYDFVVKVVFSF